jgi:hypothetical protein
VKIATGDWFVGTGVKVTCTVVVVPAVIETERVSVWYPEREISTVCGPGATPERSRFVVPIDVPSRRTVAPVGVVSTRSVPVVGVTAWIVYETELVARSPAA